MSKIHGWSGRMTGRVDFSVRRRNVLAGNWINLLGVLAFRVLIIDDDRAAAHLLRELVEKLQRVYEVYSVSDGIEALDFLHCRGAYSDAPRPHLILLDINMPRLDGLETLSAIKGDPELCPIPVIMLSTSVALRDVTKSYQAHANCYLQKPTDLTRYMKLVQAIEDFWVEFAVLTAWDEQTPEKRQRLDSKRDDLSQSGGKRFGRMIASESAEAASRAMGIDDSRRNITGATPFGSNGCEEHNHLLDKFGVAVQELLKLHEEQYQAIIEGDNESERFDLLIHVAGEKKQLSKYAYLRHVEAHGCSNANAIDQTRT
jgi:two-component system, chemotaxis family, response regulator Rcp1